MKKALSLLLAVLMLVSLFSGMAYADDDVIVEEPVVEEPVADEAPDAYTDEGNFEAADDAVVEEFTDEGSFEAADIVSITTWEDYEETQLPAGWSIERKNPANPKCGDFVELWLHDGEKSVASPRTVLYDHLWFDDEHPTDWRPDDPTLVADGVNGWHLVSDSGGTCGEGGTLVYVRECLREDCDHVETATKTVPGAGHVWATDPFTYAYYHGFDDDSRVDPATGEPVHVFGVEEDGATGDVVTNLGDVPADPDATKKMDADLNAIKVMPTTKKAGVGHEVCINCGAENPATSDYVIPVHVDNGDLTDFHLFSDWRTKVPATCSANGWEEKVCNIIGCQGSRNRAISAWDHKDPDTGKDLMVFDHIERVTCAQYVEVWVCTNPMCCTAVDKDGKIVNTYPDASQYVEYRGVAIASGTDLIYDDSNSWTTLEAATEAAEASDAYTAYAAAAATRTDLYKDAVEQFEDDNKLDKLMEALQNADEEFDAAVEAARVSDDIFFWFTGTDGHAKASDRYDHHVFESDYTVLLAPDCCVPGLNSRECTKCHILSVYETEALKPIYGTKIFTATATDIKGNEFDYHYVKCIRDGCVAKEQKDENFLKPEFKATPTDMFPTQEDNSNLQTKIVDHDWSDWVVELPPQGSNRGHWYKTCMIKGCRARDDFFGTQEEFDKAHGGEPVIVTGLVWEDEDGEWVCKLYDEDGDFEDDFTGMVEFRGGKFFVVDGYMQKDTNGPTLVGDKWYYLAAGQVQEVTTLAQYANEWFYVVDGVVDLDKVGLVEYNGGKFVVAAGRVVSEYSGLWFNSKDIGGDDEWYYVANGQVQSDFTGITVYDGEWFYLENGKLIPDYTGEVVYDGVVFEMVNGHLVAA